jgi:hypothetical protein
MNKQIQVLIGFTLISLSSCTVLTNSQIKNVNAFAGSAKSYSDFPSEIVRKRSDMAFQEKLAQAVQLPSAQIKQMVDDAQSTYKTQRKQADSIDLSLKLIQQYAILLSKLSSPAYVEDLSKNTAALNENISSLVKEANTALPNKIPANVGEALTKAIFLVGERLTKQKQAKALKEFIPQGEILIQTSVKNLTEALQGDLSQVIALDRKKFINTYTNAVLNNTSKVDFNSIQFYANTLSDYDNLDDLRKKCITAAEKLGKAHTKLNASINEKMEVTDIFEETQDLIRSVQDLFKTFKELSSNKNA